jgi:hypothetical protein
LGVHFRRNYAASGFNTDPYQADLEAAACALRAVLPDSFQNNFKVSDFRFYLHQETFSDDIWRHFYPKNSLSLILPPIII